MHDKLVDQSQKTEEHFHVLLEADMKAAVITFERGVKLAAALRSEEGAWKSEFEFVLKKMLRKGLPQFQGQNKNQMLRYYMCVCFLVCMKFARKVKIGGKIL